MPLKKAPFQVPQQKKIRLIIDTDIYCEADDHYAVAHSLMTPKFEVKAVLAEHFGNKWGVNSYAESENLSYMEACKLMRLMGLEGEIPVLEGCKDVITDGKPVDSPASRFIVEEAMKEEDRPLFVINQGAITNLASALLMKPEIKDRLIAVWIGGGTYPEGGFEYNLCNDLEAANVVMNSGVELWQIPFPVYSMMKVSLTTLYEKIYHCGEIGKYMFENILRVNEEWAQIGLGAPMDPTLSKGAQTVGFPAGESWHLGDSAGVGVMINDHGGHYSVEGAPEFEPGTGRYILRPDNPNRIRVYHSVDSHFILDDFFAKMNYYFS